MSIYKKRFAYKTGIVTTDKHPVLLKGQAVEIMLESGNDYIVRIFMTGQPEKIEKKFVLVN